MDLGEFHKEAARRLNDLMETHVKRVREQADEAAKLLREQAEQIQRDFFGAKETPAAEPKPPPG